MSAASSAMKTLPPPCRHEMNMPLSYEQFTHGWQAVFVALRPGGDYHHA